MLLNTFKKTNNKKLLLSSFLTLGAIGVSIITGEALIGSVAVATGIPYFYLELTTRERIKNDKMLPYIFFKSYIIDFSKNLLKYIENSDSLEEKKYKILFSSLWLLNQNISLKNIIDNLSKDNKKENKIIEKYHAFFKEVDLPIDVNWTEVPSGLSDYVSFSKEKLSTIKTVYKDFENSGFVGKYLDDINMPIINLVFMLQDYKLNEKDLESLKKKIEKYESKDFTYKRFKEIWINGLLYQEETIKNIEKIIQNNEPNVIDSLIEYFSQYNLKNENAKFIDFLKINKNKKILEKTLPINIKKPKVKKI